MIRWSLERGGWGQEREGERGGERSGSREEEREEKREGRRTFKPSDLGILCKYILISFYNISREC